MKLLDTEIQDVKIIEPKVYEDERGYFFEVFNAHAFQEKFGCRFEFFQSNESFSKKGTIRGMHLQMQPFAQAKLIRVCSGEIIDVALDCRPDSGSFGKHVAVRLSGKSKRQLWIPEGFAHGFQVLSDECTVNYLVNAPRNPNAEIEINCFDKDLAINWHAGKTKIMSEKDRFAKSFSEASSLFADAN
jgi:dTDP-4-dehydrorhamnose 3,5-epimerase